MRTLRFLLLMCLSVLLVACGGGGGGDGGGGGGGTAPVAPTGVVASAGDAQVVISWTASSGATSYRLMRSTTAGGPYTAVASPSAATYTDSGLSNGITYYYVLSASNAAGESARSAEVSATPVAALAPPTGVSALGADTQVTLSWNAVATATAYHVKRAANAGGPYTLVASPTVAHFTDTGRSNGTPYYYVVSVVTAQGESADSAEVSATPSAGLPVLPAEDSTRNRFGMNTWFLSDWDGGLAFADAMKQARPWQDAIDWSKPVGGIDALGWPTADASTVVLTGTPAQTNGTYKLIFNGQADVSLMWVGGTVSNKKYDAATNTTTADVTYAATATGSVGIILKNTRRTASSALNSGFTNMRLYRPGYPADGSVVFTAPYVAALAKTHAVRMMDWTATNSNLVQHWADRMTPLHFSRQGGPYTGPGGLVYDSSALGVALEHQIQLCNAVHADCWINIPVAADDDYVRKLALTLRYGSDGTNPYTSAQTNPAYPPLDPGLRVYLEYANEIWNSAGGFRCFGVIQDIVGALPAGHPLLTPAESSIWFKMWRYPAYRMALVSDIFRGVYGDASMMTRVRPVLMTQQGDGQMTLSQALNWLDSYARGQSPARQVSDYLYGAGGSGYYGATNEPADKTDRDGYFAAGNYPPAANVKGFGVDAVWGANYGLKRIAYEGGPSLDNYGDTDARALNADPRMQDMVVKTHDAWSQQGGDLLVYYVARGTPKWEFTPDITTLATPKYKALDQLQSQPRAAVTLGAALPGTIVPTDQIDYRIRSGYDYVTTCDAKPCLGGNDAGEWVAAPAHAAKAFSGALSVFGVSYTGATINVWINGVKKGQVVLATGGTLLQSTPLSVAIPAGLVVVRLEVVTGGLNLQSIAIN
ncbi:fibronectin type III domain-containing protein [Niveibacterium sp.]|uniref:fibronectin type III domain-containing protein n=1 Tax=Niveibacterium sp. TaxID=2017444 RepID=UPI0035AFE35C